MDGGAAEPVAEATVRDDAATTIQAMERRRQAMRTKKRAELKAREQQRRGELNARLDKERAEMRALHTDLDVDTAHTKEEEQRQAAAEELRAQLVQQHEEETLRQQAHFQHTAMRKQQELNQRLQQRRRRQQRQDGNRCCRLLRLEVPRPGATSVRQALRRGPPGQRPPLGLGMQQDRGEREELTAAAADSWRQQRAGGKLPPLQRPRRAVHAVEEGLLSRPQARLLSLFINTFHNLVDEQPCREKSVWLKLTPEGGAWIECFPYAVLEGGRSFAALAPEPPARECNEREHVELQTYLFADVAEVELTQPPALSNAVAQTSADKQNIGKLAQHMRQRLLEFLYRIPDDDAVAAMSAGGNRRINRKNLLLVVGYFATLCAMTALVMLAPGLPSLAIAWAAVGAAGLVVTIATKRAVVWLIAWGYTMLLLLLPASVMANMASSSSYWANAGGYLFIFVLWLSGWGFMWVQGRGDQHALACVRTVVWDESTNSATSPVLAAFHISMTKPAKKQRNLRKTAGGNEQDTSFAATAVVEKLVDLELGGRHGATQPAKLSREIRVASMDSLVLDKDGLPTAELNPEADWQRIFPEASPSKVLRELRRENKLILGDGVVGLQFLQFTERERIVLASTREDGWCIGYRKADETTKDLLGLMVSMPSGMTMQLKIWTAACASMTVLCVRREMIKISPQSGAVLIKSLETHRTLASLFQTLLSRWHHIVHSRADYQSRQEFDLLQRVCDAVCTLADEGFAYCSFSFFPAMPWESVAVPANIPTALKPANFFQAG